MTSVAAKLLLPFCCRLMTRQVTSHPSTPLSPQKGLLASKLVNRLICVRCQIFTVRGLGVKAQQRGTCGFVSNNVRHLLYTYRAIVTSVEGAGRPSNRRCYRALHQLCGRDLTFSAKLRDNTHRISIFCVLLSTLMLRLFVCFLSRTAAGGGGGDSDIFIGRQLFVRKM